MAPPPRAVVFDQVRLVQNGNQGGFVAGNTLRVEATITNTVNLAVPERVIIRTTYIRPTDAKLDRERLTDIGKTSTFTYSFDVPLPTNPEGPLGLNGTTWQGDQAVLADALDGTEDFFADGPASVCGSIKA